VQVGRTVINFSVKALNNNSRNPGGAVGEVNIDDDDGTTVTKEQTTRPAASKPSESVPFP